MAVLKTEDYLEQFPGYKQFQSGGEDTPEWWEMHPETKNAATVTTRSPMATSLDGMQLALMNKAK
jgi:hypothetical protein